MWGVQITLSIWSRASRVDEGFGLVDVDGRHSGSSVSQRSDEGAGFDQPGSAGVDQQRGWLHAREIGLGDDAPSGVDQMRPAAGCGASPR